MRRDGRERIASSGRAKGRSPNADRPSLGWADVKLERFQDKPDRVRKGECPWTNDLEFPGPARVWSDCNIACGCGTGGVTQGSPTSPSKTGSVRAAQPASSSRDARRTTGGRVALDTAI